MQLRLPDPTPGYASALTPQHSELNGVVFVASPLVGEDWDDIRAELAEAFVLTRAAAQTDTPVLYVVENAALLGQTGAGAAMVATGLLSAARTAAVEGAKRGMSVNVLAVSPASPPSEVTVWVERLLASGGVSGELIRVGGGHLGKALP